MKITITTLSCFCSLAALSVMPAHAQATPTASADASEGEGLADIVVTARKTNENVQRASISVTALNPDAIARSGIKDPTDLQTRLPGVTFQSASSIPSVNIRGIGTYNNQTGVDSAVAYSIDGIYLAHIPALPAVLVDIARVEAVRGPQGTLFGRNANGGGVGFITNKPVLGEVGASAALNVGNYDSLGTEAVLNLPLGEKAAVRGAFGSDRHDPYFRNGYGDAHNYTGRVRVLVEPVDNLEIIVSADRSRIKNRAQGVSYCPPRSGVVACSAVGWDPYAGLNPSYVPGDGTTIKAWSVYGEMNLSLDWGVITSLTGHRKYTTRNPLNLNRTGNFSYSTNADSKFFTQELRIAAPNSSLIKWVAGAFYSSERFFGQDIYGADGLPNFAFDIIGGRATSKAVFGQVTYPITDALRLTGGARYTDEKKSVPGIATFFSPTGLPTTVNTGGTSSVNRVTWKAGIDYDLSSRNLLYATVSTGFKSGGVNQVPPGTSFTPAYIPEKIIAYQVGSKNRFLNNRLQVNAEVFYYDYRNYQTFQIQVDSTGAVPGFFFSTVNSQKLTNYGGEVEVEALLSPVDRISLSAAFLHARFDRFVLPGVDYSNNDLQAAPDYSFSAAYQHRFELAGGDEIIVDIDSKLVGGHYIDNSNAGYTYQPTYTRSGASLTWQDGNGNWQVSAFVRNIENKARLSSAIGIYPQVGPGEIVAVYPPRTYGVSVRWSL
jgi:iron complex outermembrane receptor protein